MAHHASDDVLDDPSISPEQRMRAILQASKAIDPPTRNLYARSTTMAMPEPSASAAGLSGLSVAGLAAGTLLALAGGATALAALVAMCMMTPRSPKEWAVGLTSTVVSSLGGGAYAILKLGLHERLPADPAALYLTLVAGLGIVFACGLPGWALVRWLFNWIEKNRDKDLLEVAAQVRRGTQP